MNRREIKALLFDVDGTLSDSFLLGFNATQEILINNGYSKISESEYHCGTKFSTPIRLAWHATGEVETIPSEFALSLGKQFDDLYVNLVSRQTAGLYPKIGELLLGCAEKYVDIKFGALSNASGAYVKAVLEVNNLIELFRVYLGADQVSKAKPQPDGLIECCKILETDPIKCIYIGDSPTDGQAAKAAGMLSIGVSWGSHSIESLTGHFDYIVFTVNELEILLNEILNQN